MFELLKKFIFFIRSAFQQLLYVSCCISKAWIWLTKKTFSKIYSGHVSILCALKSKTRGRIIVFFKFSDLSEEKTGKCSVFDQISWNIKDHNSYQTRGREDFSHRIVKHKEYENDSIIITGRKVVFSFNNSSRHSLLPPALIFQTFISSHCTIFSEMIFKYEFFRNKNCWNYFDRIATHRTD